MNQELPDRYLNPYILCPQCQMRKVLKFLNVGLVPVEGNSFTQFLRCTGCGRSWADYEVWEDIEAPEDIFSQGGLDI